MQMGSKPKFILVFIVLFLTIAANIPDNMISRLGVAPNYLLATLVAVVITGLVYYRGLLLIVLVVLISLIANMPESFALNFGIDRDYFVATLVAIVVIPIVANWLD
ncbi:MAG: hypothetical protein OEX83_10165 [Gammaproteobacteria bacterium]|nr:hypothetical protein [Gammaproteobacteria bacterium]